METIKLNEKGKVTIRQGYNAVDARKEICDAMDDAATDNNWTYYATLIGMLEQVEDIIYGN